MGTLEDDRMVLYKSKSLDGTKPNTNSKTNPNLDGTSLYLTCVIIRLHVLQLGIQANPNPNLNTNPIS